MKFAFGAFSTADHRSTEFFNSFAYLTILGTVLTALYHINKFTEKRRNNG